MPTPDSPSSTPGVLTPATLWRPGMGRRESLAERGYVLREVMVLDEGGGFTGPCDVAVEDGVVKEVGPNMASATGPGHDFRGLWLIPGMFDCHVHVVATSLDV